MIGACLFYRADAAMDLDHMNPNKGSLQRRAALVNQLGLWLYLEIPDYVGVLQPR